MTAFPSFQRYQDRIEIPRFRLCSVHFSGSNQPPCLFKFTTPSHQPPIPRQPWAMTPILRFPRLQRTARRCSRMLKADHSKGTVSRDPRLHGLLSPLNLLDLSDLPSLRQCSSNDEMWNTNHLPRLPNAKHIDKPLHVC